MAEDPVRDFVYRNLDRALRAGEIDRFTYDSVWENIKFCRTVLTYNPVTQKRRNWCTSCGEARYPCRKMANAAEFYRDKEGYDPKWSLT